MTTSGVSLTLTAGSSSAGAITLSSNIVTNGGALAFNGAVSLGANIALDTTNGGTAASGAGVSFSNTLNGAQTLIVNGGTGAV